MRPGLSQIVEDSFRRTAVRHIHRLAHKIGEIERRVTRVEPQILGEEDASHIIQRVAVHRIAGVSLAPKDFPDLFLGGLDVQCDHFRSRAHDVAGLFLVEIQDAGEHRTI